MEAVDTTGLVAGRGAGGAYPEGAAARDRWIVERRGPRVAVAPGRAVGAFLEEERWATGELVWGATLILAGRECPWRCVMCDLWKHSLAGPTPRGAIPAQIREGLARLGGVGAGGEPVRQVKLYNGGSFFDAGAVPVADHAAVAAVVGGLERVVVECHPALVGERVLRFRDRLAAEKPGHPARLEVAMGLETVHPGVLAKLNKRMTAGDFAAAASFLVREGVDVRAFVLVQPPFMGAAEAVLWAVRSAEFAFDCGVSVVSLIPVRAANGAVEALARLGHFTAPRLETLEAAVAAGIELGRGRVFADLWDLESFSDCPLCFETRRARLDAMNRTQRLRPSVGCRCRESGGEPGGVAGDA